MVMVSMMMDHVLILTSLLFVFLFSTTRADNPIIHTGPGDSVNGSFIYPRTWPTRFREGSSINVSWVTSYQSIDLYVYQNGKVANSTQITTNLYQPWWLWQVRTEETDLTDPFVFRIVNARGTQYELTSQGFWSAGFYILRDTSSNTTVPMTSSSATSNSAPTTPSTLSATSSDTATMPSATSTAVTTTAMAFATATSGPRPDGSVLSAGAKIGIGVGVGLGVAAIISGLAAAVYFRRNRENQTVSAGSSHPLWYSDLPKQQLDHQIQDLGTSPNGDLKPQEMPAEPHTYELPSR